MRHRGAAVGEISRRSGLLWGSPMAHAWSGGAPAEAEELDAVVGGTLGSKGDGIGLSSHEEEVGCILWRGAGAIEERDGSSGCWRLTLGVRLAASSWPEHSAMGLARWLT